MFHIGLDIGTSKISAVSLDAATGRIKGTLSLPNDSGSSRRGKRKEILSEQDPDRIRKIAFLVLRKLVSSGRFGKKNIRGLGITGQMHGMLLADGKLNPRTKLITWQDKRCEGLFPGKKHDYITELIERSGGQEVFCNTGTLPAAGYMLSTLFWLKENGYLPGSGCRAALIHDWIAGLLSGSGGRIFTDPTGAGSSGVFNIAGKRWESAVLGKLGLNKDIFPEVLESGEIIGETGLALEKETGLPAGIPVCCGIGDNQASILGSAENYEETLFINIGTGSQVSVVTDRFARMDGIEARYFPHNRYALVGAGLSGGHAYALLDGFFRTAGTGLWNTGGKGSLFDRMNKLALKAPAGSEGLACEAAFTGTRLDPGRRGSLTGITPSNLTAPNLIRAVLEGVVLELHGFYASMCKNGFSGHKVIICAGNAARKNPALRRIIAEKFRLPVKPASRSEEAACGAALIAAGVAAAKSPRRFTENEGRDKRITAF